MTDFPLYQVAKQAEELIALGATVHQKFTCAKCGVRQTMEEPNKFYTQGRCEECGHVTNLELRGCNSLAIFPGGRRP